MDPNEKVEITLTRNQWNMIMQIVWKSATCEIGMPLVEALRPQLEGPPIKQIKKTSNNSVSLVPHEDD